MNRNFKIIKVDHIAFATDSIELSSEIFTKILGIPKTTKEEVKNEEVNVLKLLNDNGLTSIELLEPNSKNSIINKFINKKGKGLHHIALEVDSIRNAVKYLRKMNIALIYDTPKIGSDNKLITFIHPKSTPGLLLELCQQQ